MTWNLFWEFFGIIVFSLEILEENAILTSNFYFFSFTDGFYSYKKNYHLDDCDFVSDFFWVDVCPVFNGSFCFPTGE